MSCLYYRVIPIEPLVARDSRPIGNNTGRARSLDWLTPTVLAGAVRSALWRENICRDPKRLKEVAVSGGFPIHKEVLAFPRPHDALVVAENDVDTCYCLRPWSLPADAGVYYREDKNAETAASSLLSLTKNWKDFRFCSTSLKEGLKPKKVGSYWPSQLMESWLNEDDPASLGNKISNNTYAFARLDERVHVGIDPCTGTAKKNVLFTSSALDFVCWDKNMKTYNATELSIRIDLGDLGELPERFIAPVGGDRHLAEFIWDANGESRWRYPSVPSGQNLRMILATPAFFQNGWLPDWIKKESGTGKIPGAEVPVSLVSAIIDRWKPISGWSIEDGQSGPKAMRRMVPEGSVYFFKAERNLCADDLEKIWLHSICKIEQDKRDGLGLSLWGKWNDLEG